MVVEGCFIFYLTRCIHCTEYKTELTRSYVSNNNAAVMNISSYSWRLEYDNPAKTLTSLHFGRPVKFLRNTCCCKIGSYRGRRYDAVCELVVVPFRKGFTHGKGSGKRKVSVEDGDGCCSGNHNYDDEGEEEVALLFVYSSIATEPFPFLEILRAETRPLDTENDGLNGCSISYQSARFMDDDDADGDATHIRVDRPREERTMVLTNNVAHVPMAVRNIVQLPKSSSDDEGGAVAVAIEWHTGHTSVFDLSMLDWRDHPPPVTVCRSVEPKSAALSRTTSPCRRYVAIWDASAEFPFVDVYETPSPSSSSSFLFRVLHNDYKLYCTSTLVCFARVDDRRVRLLINDQHARLGVYGVESHERCVNKHGMGVPLFGRYVGGDLAGNGFINEYAVRGDWLVIYGFVWSPINFQEVHRLSVMANDAVGCDEYAPHVTTAFEFPQARNYSEDNGYGYDGGGMMMAEDAAGNDESAVCRLCKGAARLYVSPWEFADALRLERERKRDDRCRALSCKWWSTPPENSLRRLLLPPDNNHHPALSRERANTAWENGACPNGERERWLLRVLDDEERERDGTNLLDIGCFGAITGTRMHDRVRWLLADVAEVRQTLTSAAFGKAGSRTRDVLVYSMAKKYGNDCFGGERIPAWCRADDGGCCSILNLMRTSGIHYVLVIRAPEWENDQLEIRVSLPPPLSSSSSQEQQAPRVCGDLGIAADDSGVQVVVKWVDRTADTTTMSDDSSDDSYDDSTDAPDGRR